MLCRAALQIDFEGLGLRLRSSGKLVLAGVTGQLRAACLTAIMGPSGAGDPGLCINTANRLLRSCPTQAVLHSTACSEAKSVLLRQAAAGLSDRPAACSLPHRQHRTQ